MEYSKIKVMYINLSPQWGLIDVYFGRVKFGNMEINVQTLEEAEKIIL